MRQEPLTDNSQSIENGFLGFYREVDDMAYIRNISAYQNRNSPYYSSSSYSLHGQRKILGNSCAILGNGNTTNNSLQNAQGKMASSGITASIFSGINDKLKAEKEKQAQKIRESLRSLNQAQGMQQNPFAATSKDHEKGFLGLTADLGVDDEKKKNKPVKYNSKEVETKIQQAKTSTSAGLAVISAKRKVSEVQRQISAGEGDPEELQLTLIHARRMELVARKKKHHLEMEELVQTTLKRDERMDQEKETLKDLKNSLVSLAEEKITRKEDEIFKERQERISEAVEAAQEERKATQEQNNAMREQQEDCTQDLLAKVNEQIAKLGEDELQELEEAMEMLEEMEVVDPHMSKEDLDELKRKHRETEQKAMLKADMDYLKGMTKLQTQKGNTISPVTGVSVAPNITAGGISNSEMLMTGMANLGLSVSVGSVSEGISIDIQI